MADLLENWHLPLTDFMQRVQTYYGQATRQRLDVGSVVTRQTLRVAEWHLYGSSRLGIYKTQDTLRTVDLSLVYQLSNINIAPTQTLSKKEFYSFDSTYTHKRGDKLYEGSNHLGNVLVTFSDKRLAECLEGSVHYQADVRSATDYAAFHSLLDDRQWYSTTDSAFYRYGGSNGQEKDDEIYGTGNSYSAEFWQYDPRLARRWNVDPVEIVGVSCFVVYKNNPINLTDVSGNIPRKNRKEKTITINFVVNDLNNAIPEEDRASFEEKTRSSMNEIYGKNGITLNLSFTYTDKRPSWLKSLFNSDVYLEVENNGETRSWASPWRNMIYLNFDDFKREKTVMAHELAHLLGLSDRYNYFIRYDHSNGWLDKNIRGSSPMSQIQVVRDKNHSPNNLMSGGEEITPFQERIIWRRNVLGLLGEQRYKQILIYTWSPDADLSSIDIHKSVIYLSGIKVKEQGISDHIVVKGFAIKSTKHSSFYRSIIRNNKFNIKGQTIDFLKNNAH